MSPQSKDDTRVVAAAALRELSHTFAERDPDAETLTALAEIAQEQIDRLRAAPARDRLTLMRAAVDVTHFADDDVRSGFSDRAVAGATNPTSADLDVEFVGQEVVAHVVLRRAFEGAPGRAHGGIVAAVFDDVTGYIIGLLQEPAFTGELTVRYVAPVPVDQPLEMRARLVGRERRKLFIAGEAHHGDALVATCRATYITVDPALFRGAPDPR
jgi:acyl-coenzyme A thioesterase PaaI-like protein